MITISIDAMGGAYAPHAVIESIGLSIKRQPDLFFLIYGDPDKVLDLIAKHALPEERYKFYPVKGVISDEAKPLDAIRRAHDSSMRQAIEAVRDKIAHAAISCGSTGTLFVLSKVILGGLSGIKHPAIIGLVPNIAGQTVMLDMGGAIMCDENSFFQFALMGSCFAKILLKKDNPRIGILNIGTEQTKGRELEHKAYNLLSKSSLNFIGYAEGGDIFLDKVDVVVTDGFSGNIALKASEGAAKMFITMLRQASKNSLSAKIGMALMKRSLQDTLSKIEPSQTNGAMIIGIGGIVVKSHGNSEAPAIAHAISVAAKLARDNINDKISVEMKSLEEHGMTSIVDKIKQTSAKIFGSQKTNI